MKADTLERFKVDRIHLRKYPSPKDQSFIVLTVLIQDRKYNKCCCKSAIVPDPAEHIFYQKFVMDKGLKLSYQEAIRCFPYLQKGLYDEFL